MNSSTNINYKLFSFSKVCLIVLCFIFFSLSAVTSCIYIFRPESVGAIISDNFLFLLAGIIIFAISAFLLSKLLKLLNTFCKYSDWIIVIILTTCFCFVTYKFVHGAKEMPCSDPLACLKLAEWFLNGDYSAVAPKDSYLTLWPFQTGFILFLEKTMRLFNTTAPSLFWDINIAFLALKLISGYGLLKEFTDKEIAKSSYMIIAFSDFVCSIESTRIYGDVPCFSLLVFSAWMFAKFYNGRLWYVWGILGGGALVLAGLMKKNAQIFAIALLTIGLLMLLHNWRKYWTRLLVIIPAVCLCFCSIEFTTSYYEKKAGNTMGKGVPAVGYVAMGLQGIGGWNGFHSDTFIENDYDYDKTVAISMASIKESLNSFKEDPSHAISFFYNKYLNQWVYETRGAFWNLDLVWEEPRSAFAVSVIHGRLNQILCNISDIRLSILYLCALLGLIVSAVIRKDNLVFKSPFEILIGIFLIGGFLFSLVWEAHPGYCIIYQDVFLPICLAWLFGKKEGLTTNR